MPKSDNNNKVTNQPINSQMSETVKPEPETKPKKKKRTPKATKTKAPGKSEFNSGQVLSLTHSTNATRRRNGPPVNGHGAYACTRTKSPGHEPNGPSHGRSPRCPARYGRHGSNGLAPGDGYAARNEPNGHATLQSTWRRTPGSTGQSPAAAATTKPDATRHAAVVVVSLSPRHFDAATRDDECTIVAANAKWSTVFTGT